ncbi:MAG: major capsid protein [Lachnospiraceae bacterium]|nr:major capsid protein [Lachnospiraceae bacterium]
MARTGNFGGFEFDEEVFADMMAEEDYFRTPVIASGIVAQDDTIMDLIGEKGNVASIPIYKPLSIYEDGMEALNNDGVNNNTPVTVSGSKQTCMLIQRMKAFKTQDFTKELTGADPLTHIKNKIAGYYSQVWERELLNIAKTVTSIEALKDAHVLDLTDKDDLATAEMLIDAEQSALGDMAGGLGLIVMHSMIYAAYKKLDLVEFEKYVTQGAIKQDIELPTIGGKYVLVTDYNTLDNGVYNTFLFGEGAFRSCDKKNYSKQYYTDYDPETNAGIEKFYTKQGKVLHPNGLSLAVDSIAGESPTFAELGTSDNWSLKYNTKNVKIGLIQTGTATA